MGSLFEKWKKGLKKKVHPFCTAIVPAAGKSSRMGGEDKMFAPLCGVPVLARTLTVLDQAVLVDEIVVAAQPEKLEEVAALVSSAGIRKPVRVVEGGASRAESVLLAALEANEDVEYLAVHDGARPLVLPEQVDDLIRLGQRTYAVAPAVPVTDTDRRLLCCGAAWQGCLLDTWMAGKYQDHHAGGPVCGGAVPASAGGAGMIDLRIGHGYDVHRLVEGRPLILGGVTIPYERGLLGHSDADVLAHAVMDALLGAAALGDIGGMFPDSDERWRDADSLHLLEQVAARLAETGWEVGNVDATVLAQAPKLAPYIPEMRRRMANAMGIDAAQVSVKATTEEHLGFTGAGEGMACHAVALLGKM